MQMVIPKGSGAGVQAVDKDGNPVLNSDGDPALNVITENPIAPGEDEVLGVRKVVNGFEYTKITADLQIKNTEGYVSGFVVTGGAVTTLSLYDSTVGANTLDLWSQAATDATAGSVGVTFPQPIHFQQGLYAEIGGASAEVNILWI